MRIDANQTQHSGYAWLTESVVCGNGAALNKQQHQQQEGEKWRQQQQQKLQQYT